MDLKERAEALAEAWYDEATGDRDTFVASKYLYQLEARLASFAQEIRNEALKEVEDYLHDYRKAYDETLCPPRKLEEFDEMLRTVVAFHMGRFLLDNQIKDIRELKATK